MRFRPWFKDFSLFRQQEYLNKFVNLLLRTERLKFTMLLNDKQLLVDHLWLWYVRHIRNVRYIRNMVPFWHVGLALHVDAIAQTWKWQQLAFCVPSICWWHIEPGCVSKNGSACFCFEPSCWGGIWGNLTLTERSRAHSFKLLIPCFNVFRAFLTFGFRVATMGFIEIMFGAWYGSRQKVKTVEYYWRLNYASY